VGGDVGKTPGQYREGTNGKMRTGAQMSGRKKFMKRCILIFGQRQNPGNKVWITTCGGLLKKRQKCMPKQRKIVKQCKKADSDNVRQEKGELTEGYCSGDCTTNKGSQLLGANKDGQRF